MPKTVVLLCLLCFWGSQAFAQTDTLQIAIIPDSAALANTRAVAVYEPAKGKFFPVAAVISVIIISSYVLFNVRSK